MSKETNQYTDKDFQGWIRKLDLKDGDYTDFETKFIDSNLDTKMFSDKQREVILNMVEKYL